MTNNDGMLETGRDHRPTSEGGEFLSVREFAQ